MAWFSLLVGFLVSYAAADLLLYPNNTLVPGAVISTGCLKAMNVNIACDEFVAELAQTNFYGSLNNNSIQNSVCNPACGTALSKYHSSVVAACASDPAPWVGVPANYYGDLVWATYNLTCFKDPGTGQYCNDYISSLSFSSGDSELTSLPRDTLCSPCVIALARHIQGTAYSNYNDKVADQWKSIQTTCNLNYPTDVKNPVIDSSAGVPGFTVVNTTQPLVCLSGKTYAVVSGDTPEKIAQAHQVATGTLKTLNDILPDGSNLWAGASLCLPQSCKTYIVQPGDDCAALAVRNGITYTQFLAFNPSINSDCTNFNSGTNICIGLPGQSYSGATIDGATVTKTATYATATAVPPNNVAGGTTRHCGKYYEVQAGDYCQKVALNNTIGTTGKCYQWHIIVAGDSCFSIEQYYDISFAQFQQWNPSLDNNCSNLFLGEAYCVTGPGKPTKTSVPQPPPTMTASPKLDLRYYVELMHVKAR
ncbi:MAG: hypothetical protein M1839_001421 [Geoglossum umbratile]|nr:MAG: hypothetical protein M1839_001421 [Geoglossum umbratile]